jgi:hypothetical protein
MRFRLQSLWIPAFLAMAVFAGCSNESEGQPCDTNAGDAGSSDCNGGLVCTSNLPNANGPRCCPADRSTASTPECALATGVADANPSPPDAFSSSSGGDAEAGTGDATTDGGTGDATGPVEASTDSTTGDSTTTDGTVEGAVESGTDSASDAPGE